MLAGSRASKPEITPSSNAASRTERAMGATCPSVGVALVGKTGTLPNCAFIPKTPQKEAGMRMEPPPSVPSAKGVTPAATEVAAPALEPPVVFEVFQALRVTPESGLSPPPALQPNSVVVVLPITHAPAARARSTDGASYWTTLFSMVQEPNVVLTPPTLMRSLTEMGMPCNGPGSPPPANNLS